MKTGGRYGSEVIGKPPQFRQHSLGNYLVESGKVFLCRGGKLNPKGNSPLETKAAGNLSRRAQIVFPVLPPYTRFYLGRQLQPLVGIAEDLKKFLLHHFSHQWAYFFQGPSWSFDFLHE